MDNNNSPNIPDGLDHNENKEEVKHNSNEIFIMQFNSGTLGDGIVIVNEEDSKIREGKEKISKHDHEEGENYNHHVNIELRGSYVSRTDQKPENRIDYNDMLYKDVLFFFVNTFSGSREGLALVNMGVKKVEFVKKCSAYIFNINEPDNYKMGINTLKDYQAAGKNRLTQFLIHSQRLL